jgi:CRP-like cAMP-binding protein
LKSETLDAKEAMVDKHIAAGNREEAVKLLFDLVVSYAADKNFEKAEALNEKLYNVDPMAIMEIVRAAEAIEQAKKQSLDPDHLELWQGLYNFLSTEEGNALYYSMEVQNFSPGDVIMEQGEVCGHIYFINSGEAEAVFNRDREQLHLKKLQAGDVFGHETFFSSTVSTVSVIAFTQVKTSRVPASALSKWKAEAPLLESKLYEFCRKQDSIKEKLNQKGMERRGHSRRPIEGELSFQLLDKSGNIIGKAYKGEAGDISKGGVSFLVKTSRPENLRMLLGRRLRVKVKAVLKNREKNIFLEREGRITAVQPQAFDDYSIHLRFDTPLEKADF